MPSVLFGGIFTNTFSDAAAALISFTGLFAGAAHYGAILTNRTKPEVERATAYGFFIGFVLGALALLSELST